MSDDSGPESIRTYSISRVAIPQYEHCGAAKYSMKRDLKCKP